MLHIPCGCATLTARNDWPHEGLAHQEHCILAQATNAKIPGKTIEQSMNKHPHQDDFYELSSIIAKSYDSFSPNYKKIASFILDNPEEIAMSSTREIASILGINASTLVRFAQDLSFSGFLELKHLLQNRVRQTGSGYLERAQNLQWQSDQGGVVDLLSRIRETNQENLHVSMEQNSPDLLAQTGKMIMQARRLYICGYRLCYPVAYAMYYTCRMAREDVVLSNGVGGTVADGIRGIGPRDALVSISMEPYTRNTVATAQYAEKCGARVVALTDGKLSPLARHASVLLAFGGATPLVPGSIVAAIALVEALTAVMVATGGKTALNALHRSERQLAEFSAYIENT